MNFSIVRDDLSHSQIGHGQFTYIARADWYELSEGWSLGEVTAVATDSRDCVFVFNRSDHPVMVFAPDGQFLHSWGEGQFSRPHGIHIGPDDSVYCTDDLDHTVRKFDIDGNLLLTIGTSGCPSDTGAFSVDYRNIRRAGPPFNFPTNVALAPTGELYVADGYGNARIHKFTDAGRLLFSWGSPGREAGEFHVPHGIAVDDSGIVYVADRENSRIQRFTSEGSFIDEWTDVARPCEVFIDSQERVFVAELGFQAGMFPGNVAPSPNASGGRVSVFSNKGLLLARWGGGTNPCAPGDFFAPHDIWVDSQENIYVSEVTFTAGINQGLVGPEAHTLQKFIKV